KVLKGNLFDSAVMKMSVVSDEFRDRYLSNPKDPNAFEGRAVVFDGPEDYHARHRRAYPPVHARRRLSRLGRGGEHATAGRAHQARHHLAAVHRRWPPVRHVGFALDPQRLARGGGRRRPRAAQDRRPIALGGPEFLYAPWRCSPSATRICHLWASHTLTGI